MRRNSTRATPATAMVTAKSRSRPMLSSEPAPAKASRVSITESSLNKGCFYVTTNEKSYHRA